MMDMILPAMDTTIARDAAGEATTGSSSDAERGDFLMTLAALLPSAAGDAAEAEEAVAEALAEFASLGEGEGDELTPGGWPIPALLARFIDAAAELDPRATHTGHGDEELVDPAAGTSEDLAELIDGERGEVADVTDATRQEPEDAAPSPVAAEPADTVADEAVRILDAAAQARARPEGGGAQTPDAPTPAPGRAVAEAARAAAEAARAAATDEAGPTPDRPAAPVPQTGSLDGMDGSPVAGSASTDASSVELTAARPGSGRSFTSSAASVQRVLDAVDLLENAPPPRQLTLDLGDSRVRVAIEDGQVRLALLGKEGTEELQLLDDARAALEERGFDLSDERRRDDQDQPDARPSERSVIRTRPASRPAVAGLRL